MIPIVLTVAYLLTIGGFLYMLLLISSESRNEREQLANYYIELLLQTEANMSSERELLVAERNSLLERIQRPEFHPPFPITEPVMESNEISDEIHLVGSVQNGNPPPDEAA